MNNFSDDILQPLLDEQILKYLKICELQLPYALRAHHFLKLQFRWKTLFKQSKNDNIFRKITPKCKNSIYVPKHSDLRNCTFISLTDDACGSVSFLYLPVCCCLLMIFMKYFPGLLHIRIYIGKQL